MPSNRHLNLDEVVNPIDQTLYCSMMGSLSYPTIYRPDIIVSECMSTRFQTNPKQIHLSVIKRILIYLNHTLAMAFDIVSYSN